MSYNGILIQSDVRKQCSVFISSNAFEFAQLKNENVLNRTSALILIFNIEENTL